MNEKDLGPMDAAPPEHEVILFKTEDNKIMLEVIQGEESVWLNQKQLAELYQVGVNTISYHIAQIYDDEELSPKATVRNYRIVQTEANRRVTENKMDSQTRLKQEVLPHASKVWTDKSKKAEIANFLEGL
ncbi:MAG: hypothetical protein M0Q16_09575 [Candidatus Cloacimonetes bacterium]|nr:hypothetical protein [Candidatus Cloacimonadota bacterium]MCK9185605.1 hypothetical protein [Candidatus Cloacimonadota bacterium]